MVNTFSQLYSHIVFSVKGRNNLIKEEFREEVEKYICGIISNNKCKPLAIYCNPDHTHILIGMHPAISISELTRDIKAHSSKFINSKKWLPYKFMWQDGFGAFSYSKSQIDGVIKYILGQPKHHEKENFKNEFLNMLRKRRMEYDEKYLFEWYL